MKDTLNIMQDTVSVVRNVGAASCADSGYCLWIIVLVAILGLSIVFLFIIGIMNQRKSKFKKRAMQGEVDMKNVLNSAFLAQKLYDELRVKYHPDRYLDEEQNREATEISQLLGKYKYDYEQLLKIKERAEESLGFREQ
jgi:hypothetical protein